MVCVYGMSHAPALLLLDFPRLRGPRRVPRASTSSSSSPCAQIVQEVARAGGCAGARSRATISRSFSWRAWCVGAGAAAVVGALMSWITPFKPAQALAIGFVAGGCGTLGELVMKALKRDAGVRHWGGAARVTGAVGLLDRVAPLCFAAPVFFHSVRWYFGV